MISKATYEFLFSCIIYTLIDLQKHKIITTDAAESIGFFPKHKMFIRSKTKNRTISNITENALFYTNLESLIGEKCLLENLNKDQKKLQKLLKSLIEEDQKYAHIHHKSLIEFRDAIK
ncbi:hypothetical protein N5853_09945 [Bartonella sp. HY329]|uniref:hypothetical protein n=1 Tax=unclassified Bartonella TaxID=2645622 RepID=UPI0021C8EEB2|nr:MULTISPECIES: hypothetical protein [unclassified Bartonella]UXM94424.1 hypothetical protein N5853_09945 [Bartonella sp. HY329]UXN08748.1 hypothetical protein N5852_09955 [Bartonella sp. HY328]